MSADRIRDIEEKLANEDLSSHERDQLKRELNKLRAQQGNGGGISAYRTLGIVALALALVIGGGYALAAMGLVHFNVNSPTGNVGAPVDPSQIPIDGEPVLGDTEAPVTIVLYEDFECPYCQQFDAQIFPRLVQDYVDTGAAKIVWKDFPLTRAHPWAMPAATTMECVYRQDNDAFWAVKTQMYNNQGALTANNAQSRILDWAAAEGVAKNDVRTCLRTENPTQEVQQDLNEGQSLGVTGTPMVFINGQPVQGLAPYNQYTSIIENELQ